MRGLVFVTWAHLGLHTILWLIRALKERKTIKAHLKPVSGPLVSPLAVDLPRDPPHARLLVPAAGADRPAHPLPGRRWAGTVFTLPRGTRERPLPAPDGRGPDLRLRRRLRRDDPRGAPLKGEKGLFRGPNTPHPAPAGCQGHEGQPAVVHQGRRDAEVRPLDLLREVGLHRRGLGRPLHRDHGPDHVVADVLHEVPAGLRASTWPTSSTRTRRCSPRASSSRCTSSTRTCGPGSSRSTRCS